MVQFTSTITTLAVLCFAGQALAGGAIVGALAKGVGEAAGSAAIGAVTNNNQKMRRVVRSTPPSNNQVSSTFSDCMNTVHQTPVHHVINPDHTVIVSGLPAVCIAEVNTYNALPNIADLNKVQGAVSVVNSTSIKVSGLPSTLTDFLDHLGKQ